MEAISHVDRQSGPTYGTAARSAQDLRQPEAVVRAQAGVIAVADDVRRMVTDDPGHDGPGIRCASMVGTGASPVHHALDPGRGHGRPCSRSWPDRSRRSFETPRHHRRHQQRGSWARPKCEWRSTSRSCRTWDSPPLRWPRRVRTALDGTVATELRAGERGQGGHSSPLRPQRRWLGADVDTGHPAHDSRWARG